VRVRAGDQVSLQWYRFEELGPALLYELLRFRQAIFVVEQSCAYPDLDGLDQGAQHLLLRIDGALAGCVRLIPFPESGGSTSAASRSSKPHVGRASPARSCGKRSRAAGMTTRTTPSG
jgi:predicted GNAT family N-acyltransferase